MNSGENIVNAFRVVSKTYENIDKLIEYCHAMCAKKETHYAAAVSKFLRFTAKNDFDGWYIQEFYLLFQDTNDKKIENGWRAGPLYVMEINLTEKDIPTIYLSKFEYNDISEWSAGCRNKDFLLFFQPLRDKDMIVKTDNDKTVRIAPPSPGKEFNEFWEGLKQVTTREIPLMDVTSQNVKEKVFGTFATL